MILHLDAVLLMSTGCTTNPLPCLDHASLQMLLHRHRVGRSIGRSMILVGTSTDGCDDVRMADVD